MKRYFVNHQKGSDDEDESIDPEENRKSRNSKKSIGRRSSRQSFSHSATGRRKSTVAFAGEDISDEEERQMKGSYLDLPLEILG